MGKEKYSNMRKDKDIMRWHRDASKNSEITGNVYLRRLGSFCEKTGKDPHELLKMKDKQLADLISDYVSDMEKENHSGGYISSTIKGVKSWLTYNGIKLQRKITISGSEETPTLENKVLFNQEDLKKVLSACNVRSRMAVSIVAFSGIRLQSLGNEAGKDGIKLSDLPDLILDRECPKFDKIPAKIIIRKEISKKRHEYFTFLGPEGCGYVLTYLNERNLSGEDLTGDSPLLTKSKFNLRKGGPFLTRTKVSELIRKAIRTAGYENRPYDLRPYFASRMLMAQDERLVQRDYRTFWMGHKGDIEHTYTTARKLPEDQIEAMRKSYEKALRFLETEERGIKEEDSIKIQRETAIFIMETAFRMKLTDEQKEELSSLDIADLQKRLGEIFQEKRVQELNNGNKHKTIPEEDLETYLNKGWELVQIYPKGDKAVIKLPS